MVFLPGGISHVDTFDRKPALEKHHGQETRGENTITPFFGRRGTVMKSPFEFKQYGESGHWVSEILPNLGGVVDDLTFVHSMVARSNAHGPALFQMSTGFIFQGFPAIGSWVSYGLGSENENLPSFVVLPDRRGLPPCGAALWGNGFLPASHQGVILGGASMPIADLDPPGAVSARQQSASYDLLSAINHEHVKLHEGEDALAARIKAYELGERPMPLPELEALVKALGGRVESFFDRTGPIGQWLMNEEAIRDFLELPLELRQFVAIPVNRPYLELAMKLSNMSRDKLRSVAEDLLDITF
jgi:hypothetical protein